MIEFLKILPPQVWTIVAVGLVGFILFVGLRVLRSGKVEIDVGSVDISLDKNKPTAPDAQPPTSLPPPSSPAQPS